MAAAPFAVNAGRPRNTFHSRSATSIQVAFAATAEA
jgi:hypothetical protein